MYSNSIKALLSVKHTGILFNDFHVSNFLDVLLMGAPNSILGH